VAPTDYSVVQREAAPDLAVYWTPADDAVAALVFVHGFAEHAGRYAHVFRAFPRCHCLGFDLRGHGNSGGPRGHIRRFDEYRQDLAWALEEARSRGPGLPLFLVGHSFGGLVATEAVLSLQTPLAGLILSSPGFALQFVPPVWERGMARLMTWICPGLTRPARVPVDRLSHDPAVAERVLQDPLSLRRASVRWYTECLAAQRRVLAAGRELRIPLLCLVAGQDALVVPEATRVFFDTVASLDKRLEFYPEAYHELFQETEQQVVFELMWRWCEARLPGMIPKPVEEKPL